MPGTHRKTKGGKKADDVLTRRELAELLGVHMQTVTKWEHEGMPIAERGRKGRPSKYSAVDVKAWQTAREQAAAEEAPDLMKARARKELAQAIEAEQRVALRAKELIRIEDVDRIWSAQVAAIRARLLALPTALADRLLRIGATDGAAGIERALEDAVHEALRELATGTPAPTATKPRRAAKAKKARRRRTNA